MAHYFYPDGVAAVLLGRALGRPVVVTARGSDLNLIAHHSVPRRWILWAARHADGLIAVSSGLKQRLVELGVAAERVEMLRNGVDLTLFRPQHRDRARKALGLSRPTLLAVGNLVALKRHRLMIEAVAQMPDVELVIAGDGPERPALERLAGERQIADRVRFLGHVAQGRLPEIYSAADLLVLVSASEGWPNVLLESMACGTPVVVSDLTGITDIVGAPEAGRILAEVTPSRLAATARDLLAATPPRAQTRRYAEQFDWESTTKGQIALFHRILQRHSRRGSRSLMVQDAVIDLDIAGHTVRPRPFAIDELDRARPDARPGFPIGQRREHAFGEGARIVRRKQISCLAIANQLAMSADARGDDDPLLRHRLERLQRGDQFRQPVRHPREDEKIDQIVIRLHLLVRHATGKDDAVVQFERADKGAQFVFVRSAADQQDGDFGPLPLQTRERAEQQIEPFIGIKRTAKAEHDFSGKAHRRRSGTGPECRVRERCCGPRHWG